MEELNDIFGRSGDEEVDIETDEEDLNESEGSFSLVRKLHLFLDKLTRDEGSHRAEGYHPSQSFNLCPRRKLLEEMYEEEDRMDVSGRKSVDIGTAVHEMIQEKWLGPMQVLRGGWKCRTCGEVHRNTTMPSECSECGEDANPWSPMEFLEPKIVDDTVGIIGHADGILEIEDEPVRVLDIKTTSNLSRYMSSGPSQRHEYQIQVYMHYLGIDWGVIWYYDKASNDFYFVHIKRNDQYIKNLHKKIGWDIERKEALRDSDPEEDMLEEEWSKRICDTKGHERAKWCPVKQECFKHGSV